MVKSYETVLVFTPVLKDNEVKEIIANYREMLKSYDAEIVEEDFWGLRQLAYPIKKKTTGIYLVVEYKVESAAVEKFEIQFKRDENVLRFLTTRLDKYSMDYNEKKRQGIVGKKEYLKKRKAAEEEKAKQQRNKRDRRGGGRRRR